MISGSTSPTVVSPTANNLTHMLDLTAKCEEYEQKYNRLQLENNQYKQYIEVIEQQKEDLKSELLQYENDDCSEIQPILADHISSIQASLQNNDNTIYQLTNKLSNQSELIKKLRLQISQLSQENSQYRETLEINNKKTELKQRISNNKNESQQNKITSLQNENQLLSQELSTLKAMTCFESQMSDNTLSEIAPKIENEHTFHFDTFDHRMPSREPTIEITADSLAQIIKYQTINAVDMEQFGLYMDNNNKTERFYTERSERNNLLLNDIQIKMNKLENENIELKELLQEFKSEQCKFIDEESDIDYDEDNKNEYDELHDLEQLFQKISSTHTYKEKKKY
eukprot:366758_1